MDALDADPDAAALAAFARGEPAAAAMLTHSLAPRARAVARGMLGDAAEAEDVAQEAMMRLWRIAPDWRGGEARVSTWLIRVVMNLCTDRLRRRKRLTGLDDAMDPADDSPSAAARLLERDRTEALYAALQHLPERQREAVVLRHLEGMSNPQIAAVMDIGVEAVESLTARAKRALTALLADRKEALGYEDDRT